jgi:hypothetical protein
LTQATSTVTNSQGRAGRSLRNPDVLAHKQPQCAAADKPIANYGPSATLGDWCGTHSSSHLSTYISTERRQGQREPTAIMLKLYSGQQQPSKDLCRTVCGVCSLFDAKMPDRQPCMHCESLL